MEKVEFRDGERWVPPHVAFLLNQAGIEPHTLTYKEAIEQANQGLVKRRLADAQRDVIANHFRQNR